MAILQLLEGTNANIRRTLPSENGVGKSCIIKLLLGGAPHEVDVHEETGRLALSQQRFGI
ncbi:hypothetical protein RvY_04422 [Ramazzottius varieornatus]|uniref:Uncharacterized protein n=1 Tax=Ramazzottius varieornatus TaxID=947166 RepID=A0A1D1URJ4_RAMVA|nr:hypothetical protein RvY_04422 [Ramazzottius varieornatus]